MVSMKITPQVLKAYLDTCRDRLVGHYISHPVLLNPSTIAFHVSGRDGGSLVICLDQTHPRFYLGDSVNEKGKIDRPFMTGVRHELTNAFCKGIEIVNNDMIIRLDLEIVNKVYKEERRILYIELIPHHPNLVITNGDDVVQSLYRASALTSKRPLAKNLAYVPPAKPEYSDAAENVDPEEYLAFCRSLETSIDTEKRKSVLGAKRQELLRQKKSLENKLRALNRDLNQATIRLNDTEKGDFIYTHLDEIHSGDTKISDGETVVILDPLLSPAANAERYYRSAKKAKLTLSYSNQYIAETQKQLDKTNANLALLEEADVDQLESCLQQVAKKSAKQRRHPNLISSTAELPYRTKVGDVTVLFGRNATQNRCLTFYLGKAKNHVWLHIQGQSGSHFLIQKDFPTEEEIRFVAAMAIYAAGREDGTVEAAYRKDIRQGSTLGEVILNSYWVIRIDNVPNEAKKAVDEAQK